MNKLENVLKYFCPKSSSLSFWWLKVEEGEGYLKLNLDNVRDYYLDFSNKSLYKGPFDKNGVPLLDYKGSIGKQYNPCAIAQYGLGLISKYLKTKKLEMLEKAIIQGNWLCENIKISKNNIGRLEYNFGDASYVNIKKGYISAIAQGQAISLLLRLFIITGDKKYMLGAENLFRSFLYPISENGVVNFDKENNIFLEEALTSRVSCILDGFIYAIFGVYDYYLITNSEQAKELFDNCCKTLKKILPKFDLGFWSRADMYLERPKMPASYFYHNVHIYQLKAMYSITKIEDFQYFYILWKRYRDNIFYRYIALVYKCYFKIFYY